MGDICYTEVVSTIISLGILDDFICQSLFPKGLFASSRYVLLFRLRQTHTHPFELQTVEPWKRPKDLNTVSEGGLLILVACIWEKAADEYVYSP